MHRSPATRKLFPLLVLTAGAAASIATSERVPPALPPLEASASGPAVVLGTGGMLASHTVTAAINDEFLPEGNFPYGNLYVHAGACVTEADVPGRLRVTVIPEHPGQGATLEADIPSVCPVMTPLELSLPLFTTCGEGVACAERFDLEFQRFGLATSAMTAGFSVDAVAGGYGDELPEGAELTVVIE